MVWNEQDHPRDDDGKFTFKNGGVTNKTNKEILFEKSNKQKELQTTKQKRKNELLDILKDKATPADILYADNEKLEKKIKEYGLKENKISQNTSHFYKPAQGKISGEFGLRKQPTSGASNNHSGMDIAIPIGTPIKTVTSGTVIKAGESKGYGIAVFIDHGTINGKRVVSEYGHLSKCEVKVGDKVSQGQVIAKSGNTGISTGPHLHITIRENGHAVNPRNYIKFD